MRSYLFVPGDSERKLAKGAESGADAVILDLEDSVAADRKPGARQTALAYLKQYAGAPNRPRLVGPTPVRCGDPARRPDAVRIGVQATAHTAGVRAESPVVDSKLQTWSTTGLCASLVAPQLRARGAGAFPPPG